MNLKTALAVLKKLASGINLAGAVVALAIQIVQFLT